MSALKKFFFKNEASETTVPVKSQNDIAREPEGTTRHREETLGMLNSALRDSLFDDSAYLLGILTKYHSQVPDMDKVVLMALDTIAWENKKAAFEVGISACGAAPYKSDIRDAICKKLIEISADFQLEDRIKALKDARFWSEDKGEIAFTANHLLFELIDKTTTEKAISIAGSIAKNAEGDRTLEKMAVNKWLELVRKLPPEKAIEICGSTPNPYRGGGFPHPEEILLDKTAANEWSQLARQLPPEKVIFLARRVHIESNNSTMGLAISTAIDEARTRLSVPVPRLTVQDFVKNPPISLPKPSPTS